MNSNYYHFIHKELSLANSVSDVIFYQLRIFSAPLMLSELTDTEP